MPDIDAVWSSFLRAFRKKVEPKDAPILAPLGTSHKTRRERLKDLIDRLPAAAGPIAYTLVTCLIIIVVLGSILAGGNDRAPRQLQVDTASHSAGNDLATTSPGLADTSPLPTTAGQHTDPAPTASIPAIIPPPSALRPEVGIAQSEDDVTALEEEQRTEPLNFDSSTTEDAVPGPDDGMREAQIIKNVNMRAGASDKAKVLEVVPAKARIQAEEDCDWCPVLYEGRSGFIYRSFISYE
jgi:hypothetical protein